jgi:uncharacterized protein (DUF427 family)
MRETTMKAIWKGVVIAESDDTFSNHRTSCPWKGQAHYKSLLVNGEMNPDAVWYYPEPSEAAKTIKGRVAFWKGVMVE